MRFGSLAIILQNGHLFYFCTNEQNEGKTHMKQSRAKKECLKLDHSHKAFQ